MLTLSCTTYVDFKPFAEAVARRRERPTIPGDASDSMASLMTDCWAHEPAARPSFAEVLPRLDDVLLDSVVHTSAAGRAFWRSYFAPNAAGLQRAGSGGGGGGGSGGGGGGSGSEPSQSQGVPSEVSWDDFARALAAESGESLVNIGDLASLLAGGAGVSMSMQRFDMTLRWYGDYFSPVGGRERLGFVRRLLGANFFHGDIDRGTAERRLLGRERGTYLVRLSDRASHPMTMSLVTATGGVQHKRLKVVGDAWFVPVDGNKTLRFASLFELVAGTCADGVPCKKEAVSNSTYVSGESIPSDVMLNMK